MVSEKTTEEFRQGLPFLSNGLFLNYAATAPLTNATIKIMQKGVEATREPLGLRFYEALNQLEFARREFAELLGADPTEICFTSNTSMALSTIALAIDWHAGDRILVPDDEFPSNYYPWENLKSQGVICEKIKIEAGKTWIETLQGLDLKKVRLISVSAVSYQSGRRTDAKLFADFCRERGILSCFDAIQAIGAVPLHVRQAGIDFVASGAQKWTLGPTGCGVLYARRELLPTLKVPYIGWTSLMYAEYMDLGPLQFAADMTRFEPGLPNLIPYLGVHQSLQEMRSVGWDKIYAQIQSHTQYLREEIKAMGFSLLCDDEFAAGITSFYVPHGMDHREVEEAYKKHDIKITARKDYVRVSPHFFNTAGELEQFIKASGEIFKRNQPTRPRKPNKSIGETPSSTQAKKILICGAAGNLGREIAQQLAHKGFELLLVDRDAAELEAVRKDIAAQNTRVESTVADFSEQRGVDAFLDQLKPGTWDGLIYCAGVIASGLAAEVTNDLRNEIEWVNYRAPAELSRKFFSHLQSHQALGVMNVVSSTGRCGSPLLADYGASNAALWTFTESLGRERSGEISKAMLFVAPAMHSPMQKRIGRNALRYFKMQGSFDYSTAPEVAREAIERFLARKPLTISKLSRAKILMNSVLPEFVSKKISAAWYSSG